MAILETQVTNLLFAPLPELNPPSFSFGTDQLDGLGALPAFCDHLKLIFGLRRNQSDALRFAPSGLSALPIQEDFPACR